MEKEENKQSDTNREFYKRHFAHMDFESIKETFDIGQIKEMNSQTIAKIYDSEE